VSYLSRGYEDHLKLVDVYNKRYQASIQRALTRLGIEKGVELHLLESYAQKKKSFWTRFGLRKLQR
jgi:hypothetical protein